MLLWIDLMQIWVLLPIITAFKLDAKMISAFVVLSAFVVFLSWEHLVQPLWGDQIYHAQYAARHGQLAIFMLEHGG